MKAIHRKLLREVWHLRSQLLSIALVVATGLMTVVTMRGSYESLVIAQQAYYQDTRFADIWINLRRAPDSLRAHISNLPGVAAADTRITRMATLDLEGLDAPALGRFVSLPAQGSAVLNLIYLKQGRSIDHAADNEVIINEKFAVARNLRSGDTLTAIVNGRARQLDIVGVAISPEHVYTIPPGSLMPDDSRFAVLWMSERALAPAYQMEGAFNEAYVRLSPGADSLAVISQLNQLLQPYGGLGAYARKDQPSHLILQGELDQNRVMGTVVPAVFLSVAVFLLHLVLSRLISTQRGEIAVLKAFGYHNDEVGFHYLSVALIAVGFGIVLGTLGGFFLGQAYIGIYQQYFDLPGLQYQMRPTLWLLATLICLAGACTGAIQAVWQAVALPPADAMRPEAPARFRAGIIERTGLAHLLPAAVRMIVRNMGRKPIQALLSSLGVAFSVAILVIGFFMLDSIQALMDRQFRDIQREDVAVSFYEPLTDRTLQALWRLPGVMHVESWRSVPVRLRAGHLYRETGIQSVDPDGQLRRLVSSSGAVYPIPAEGLVLSRLLAAHLQVSAGDTVRVELLEGQRRQADLPVSGVVDDFMGVSAYMAPDALDRLSAEPQRISGAYLRVAADQRAHLYQILKQTPQVAGVSSPAELLQSFEEEMAQNLFISIGFLIGFAAVIAVGVIYNGARIALSERGRELASLRVLGFHQREVAALLLGEQAIITLCAIPLGWLLGYGLAWAVVQGMQTDMFRLPFVVSMDTALYSGLITALAATASALAVRRRLARADLISVLKTRE